MKSLLACLAPFVALAACGGATLSDFDGDGSIDSVSRALDDLSRGGHRSTFTWSCT